MACKICQEWQREAERHKRVARELSIKLADAYEKMELAMDEIRALKKAIHEE